MLLAHLQEHAQGKSFARLLTVFFQFCSYGVCEVYGDRLELCGAGALDSATFPFKPAAEPRGKAVLANGQVTPA